MQPFSRLDAIAAPLPIANIDTDKILAGRFLKTITREGLGERLFWTLRQKPDFVLNRSPWDKAEILVALENFGCGSSREHAPWALLDFGIRCIVAPSIADIFYNNCFKNGILPIVLPPNEIATILKLIENPATARISVDLPEQALVTADGLVHQFPLDVMRKDGLLGGVDDIARSISREAVISSYETRLRQERPWLRDIMSSTIRAGL